MMPGPSIRARRWRCVAAVCAALQAAAGISLAQESSGSAPSREIALIRDDLYRVRDGAQYTVFLVTPEGIIIGDPLTRATALWLRAELATRFPDKPVRYVLHTHLTYERAQGASVFDDTAERVAHRAFDGEWEKARRHLPETLVPLDRNNNGRLSREELAGTLHEDMIPSNDTNGNGSVSPLELLEGVGKAESRYEIHRTISLGGRTVELVHAGMPRAPDKTVLLFPSARVAVAVDPPPVTITPFAFRDAWPQDVFAWLRAVAPLDFDTLLTGEGITGSHADLVVLREYLDALDEAVADAQTRGLSFQELEASPALAPFAGGPHYARRATQLSDVYSRVHYVAVEGAVGVMSHRSFEPGGYCTDFAECRPGGAVGAGTVALRAAVGRRLHVNAELTSSRQELTARSAPSFDEEIAFRTTRVSLLAGFGSRRGRKFSYAFLGGASYTIGDARGAFRVKATLPPAGGRFPVDVREWAFGVTGGVDLTAPLGHGLGLVVPVRVTQTMQGGWPARWSEAVDLQIGAGVTFSLLRHAR
jgi:hypothetical protein